MPGMSGTVVLNEHGYRAPNFHLTGTLPNGSAVEVAKIVNIGEVIVHQVNHYNSDIIGWTSVY